MTWAYSGDPSVSTKDEVRFLIGDTDTTDQQISDEEITYAIANAGSTKLAAAIVARAIAAKYARFVSKSVGDLSIQYAQRQQHYHDLADILQAEGNLVSVAPYAGGISVADKTAQESDTDRVLPSFTKGMHDGDGSSEESTSDSD